MQHRDYVQKWIMYAVAALFFMLVQSGILLHIRLWGVHPFLYPALVSTLAVLETPHESVIFSLALGVALDITMPGIIPCFYTLTFLVVFVVTRLLTVKIIASQFVSCMLCGVLSLVCMGLLHMLFLQGKVSFHFTDGLLLSAKEVLITALLLPLLYLPMHKINEEFNRQ